MIYKILKQSPTDERIFLLEQADYPCSQFWVDIYTDGELAAPTMREDESSAEFNDRFDKWLQSLVGKEIYIDHIDAYRYFSGGKTYIIDSTSPEEM